MAKKGRQAMSSYHINTMLGSSLCLLFIFIDYFQKYQTDFFQRKLFCTLLVMTFASVLASFFWRLFEGMAGETFAVLLYACYTIFLILQNIALYLTVVFFDYMLHKETQRTKSTIIDVSIIIILYAFSVLLNIPFGYYFTITPDNIIVLSKMFFVSLLVTYFPMLLVSIYLILHRKKANVSYMGIFFAFLLLCLGSGIADDFILKESNLFWHCFTTGLLYIYFFIIQTDAKIDALTGINNRFAFNEYLDRITHQRVEKPYAIAMIDIDSFKHINDSFGHTEGDNALRDIALIIRSNIRLTDFAARYGGDEFVIVTDSVQSVRTVLERVDRAIDQQNKAAQKAYRLQISYGFGVYVTNSNQNIELFIDHIDRLMYQHKNSKRA
jgi:diguanylate cyclase (GGDEF)-like protein